MLKYVIKKITQKLSYFFYYKSLLNLILLKNK